MQGKPTIRHADLETESWQNPDETTGRLLRQLCLQGVSWQIFRKNGLQAHVSPASEMLCPVCKSKRDCLRCEKPLREKDFDKDPKGELYKVCRACQHPTCSNCGATRESIWNPNPKVEEPVPLCDVCEKRKRSCRLCEKSLREVDFDKDSSGRLYKVCRACQHPTCSNCGATRGSIWTPNPKVEEPVPLCDVCESKRTCAE